MMETYKNKLLNKYLFRDYLLTGAFVVAAGTNLWYLEKFRALHQEQEKQISQNDNKSVDNGAELLCFVAIVFCSVLAFGSAQYTDGKRKTAYNITKKYLVDLINQLPKENNSNNVIVSTDAISERDRIINAMQQFSGVFHNKYALMAVTNVICNSLTKSEQAEILKCTKEYANVGDKTRFQRAKLAKDIRDKIVNIIKQHESIDPNFMSTILSAMKGANTQYVVPMQQLQPKTR